MTLNYMMLQTTAGLESITRLENNQVWNESTKVLNPHEVHVVIQDYTSYRKELMSS